MKIHLVSGKGGVGKSTWASVLALKAARMGLKTLLVELGEKSFFSYVFHPEKPNIIPKNPVSILHENLFWTLWDAKALLSEYVLHLIKIPALHRLFFDNPVTQALVDAAPGLRELAILGKITSGPPRNVGPRLPYDILVVDAYSSGHFWAMLHAPEAMARTFHMGPMMEQSRAIMEVLNTPEITSIHLVTLPERLPIEETIESYHQIRSLLPKTPIQVCLNGCLKVPQGPWPNSLTFQKEKEERAKKLLLRELPVPLETAYLQPSNDFSEVVRRLANP